MTNASRAYVKVRNETASKERLMVLLFETALRHMRVAATAIEQGRPAQAGPALSRASQIVTELLATLDSKRDPQLHQNLSGLYVFVSDRLLQGQLTRTAAPVREAERVFAPIAEAFAQAVKQVEQNAKELAR